MHDNDQQNDVCMSIYIDVEDKRNGLFNSKTFYFHPSRLSPISLLTNSMFEILKIKNTETEKLTHNNYCDIFKCLQPLAKCEIVIYNPNNSLIEKDCSLFETNAKQAGFTNFQYRQDVFHHPITKEYYTSYAISFQKPLKVQKKKIFERKKEDITKKLADIQISVANLKETIRVQNKWIPNLNPNFKTNTDNEEILTEFQEKAMKTEKTQVNENNITENSKSPNNANANANSKSPNNASNANSNANFNRKASVNSLKDKPEWIGVYTKVNPNSSSNLSNNNIITINNTQVPDKGDKLEKTEKATVERKANHKNTEKIIQNLIMTNNKQIIPVGNTKTNTTNTTSATNTNTKVDSKHKHNISLDEKIINNQVKSNQANQAVNTKRYIPEYKDKDNKVIVGPDAKIVHNKVGQYEVQKKTSNKVQPQKVISPDKSDKTDKTDKTEKSYMKNTETYKTKVKPSTYTNQHINQKGHSEKDDKAKNTAKKIGVNICKKIEVDLNFNDISENTKVDEINKICNNDKENNNKDIHHKEEKLEKNDNSNCKENKDNTKHKDKEDKHQNDLNDHKEHNEHKNHNEHKVHNNEHKEHNEHKIHNNDHKEHKKIIDHFTNHIKEVIEVDLSGNNHKIIEHHHANQSDNNQSDNNNLVNIHSHIHNNSHNSSHKEIIKIDSSDNNNIVVEKAQENINKLNEKIDLIPIDEKLDDEEKLNSEEKIQVIEIPQIKDNDEDIISDNKNIIEKEVNKIVIINNEELKDEISSLKINDLIKNEVKTLDKNLIIEGNLHEINKDKDSDIIKENNNSLSNILTINEDIKGINNTLDIPLKEINDNKELNENTNEINNLENIKEYELNEQKLQDHHSPEIITKNEENKSEDEKNNNELITEQIKEQIIEPINEQINEPIKDQITEISREEPLTTITPTITTNTIPTNSTKPTNTYTKKVTITSNKKSLSEAASESLVTKKKSINAYNSPYKYNENSPIKEIKENIKDIKENKNESKETKDTTIDILVTKKKSVTAYNSPNTSRQSKLEADIINHSTASRPSKISNKFNDKINKLKKTKLEEAEKIDKDNCVTNINTPNTPSNSNKTIEAIISPDKILVSKLGKKLSGALQSIQEAEENKENKKQVPPNIPQVPKGLPKVIQVPNEVKEEINKTTADKPKSKFNDKLSKLNKVRNNKDSISIDNNINNINVNNTCNINQQEKDNENIRLSIFAISQLTKEDESNNLNHNHHKHPTKKITNKSFSQPPIDKIDKDKVDNEIKDEEDSETKTKPRAQTNLKDRLTKGKATKKPDIQTGNQTAKILELRNILEQNMDKSK